MNDQLIMIARKKGSIIYFDPETENFVKADRDSDELLYTVLERDYWKLDEIIESQEYKCFDGVLVEPVEEKLILNSNMSENYMISRHEFEKMTKDLI